MIKQTSPFGAIRETTKLLRNLGADPEIRFEGEPAWQDYTISMDVRKQFDYATGEDGYTVWIHLNPKGFDILSDILKDKVEVTTYRLSNEYMQHNIELRAGFKIFKLEWIPEEER